MILVLGVNLGRRASDGHTHRTFSVLGGGGRLPMDWVAGVDGRQWLIQGGRAAVGSAYSTDEAMLGPVGEQRRAGGCACARVGGGGRTSDRRDAGGGTVDRRDGGGGGGCARGLRK